MSVPVARHTVGRVRRGQRRPRSTRPMSCCSRSRGEPADAREQRASSHQSRNAFERVHEAARLLVPVVAGAEPVVGRPVEHHGPDGAREHLRVRDADDRPVRVAEIVELGLAEGDADRLEVARDVAGAELGRVRAHALNASGRELLVVAVQHVELCGGRRNGGERVPEVEERVVDAVDRARRTGATGIEAHDVEAGSHFRREPRPRRCAGSRRLTHRDRRSSRRGTRCARPAIRPDGGAAPAAPCRSAIALLPVRARSRSSRWARSACRTGSHRRSRPRTARRRTPAAGARWSWWSYWSWWSMARACPDLAVPARSRRAARARRAPRRRRARGRVVSRPGGFAPWARQAELARVQDAVRIERGLGRGQHRRTPPRARRGANRARFSPTPWWWLNAAPPASVASMPASHARR